ncbi:MAG: hypothetical protein IJ226_03030 [Clostridia bacterium]|nr:hypothetical protein [Clostridia bacterium]
MRTVSTNRRRLKIGFKGIVNSVDEKELDFAFSNRAHNVTFEREILTSSIGMDPAAGFFEYPNKERHTFPKFASSKSIKNVFTYNYNAAGTPDYRIVVQLVDGTFWFTKIMVESGWAQIADISITGDVEAVNYRYNGEDILLIASKDDKLYYIKGNTAYACNDAPHFASITIHSERVFGAVNGAKTRLWFSDDFNPANWDIDLAGAGFIEFADECGDILRVISFLGYLYVIRDYGIFRLTAYGDQESFALKKVFTDTGRIYKHSIVLAGDKIIFLADEGLFAFDGYDVVRIAKEFPLVASKDEAVGAYLDKRYFLACNIDAGEEYATGFRNNAVVVYDMFEKSLSELVGVDVRAIREVKTHSGSMLVCAFDKTYKNRLGMIADSGQVFGTNLKKTYASPFADLGTATAKTIREVQVKTKYPVSLTVKTDDNDYSFDLEGSDKPQRVIVEKSGVIVGIEIVSEEQNLEVAPVIAIVDFMTE